MPAYRFTVPRFCGAAVHSREILEKIKEAPIMLTNHLREHYLKTGRFTYAGPYADYFRTLPDSPRELSELISHQVIHRVTLANGNIYANQDLRYGDMNRWPWHRLPCEDDLFLTAPAMTAELFRLDGRGFVPDRQVENKVVLTCRFVAVLAAAIYKAKGTPCRCRAGYAPYFQPGISMDHWINQVWSDRLDRWVTFDADGLYDGLGLLARPGVPFTPYDMGHGQFDWAAEAWLRIRAGQENGARYVYADCQGTCGLRALGRYLVYDLFALMNDEISYVFRPRFMDGFLKGEEELTGGQLEELDQLARLLREPDENFGELEAWWETRRHFRDLTGPLI